MSLFDDIVRSEIRPKRQNEGTFEYLNSSARPFVCAIRELLDGWYAALPEKARTDLRARFRKKEPVQHLGAFFELYWHQFLLRSGYTTAIHPSLTGVKTNPDFLAIKEGCPCFYLEATLAMPTKDMAADRRLAELHDTLDRMDSPDFFVSFEYEGIPKGNIGGRNLRKQLGKWLKGLDYEEVSRLHKEGDLEAIPKFSWSEGGFSLRFSPMPKGPDNRGRPGVRPIGIVSPGARFVRAHDDLKSALDGKGKRYGSLDLPLIIAVNVMEDFFDEIDLHNALFGEEQIIVSRDSSGEWQQRFGTRKPNGAWFGLNGPRNTAISATFIASHLLPWTLRSTKVELIHNPWAVNPIPLDTFRVPQKTVSQLDGMISRHEGILAADMLGVPAPWPVPDPD